MATIYDSRPIFFDELAKPLGNGRIVVYKTDNTTLADLYDSSEYSTSLLNPQVLDSSGRLSQTVYVPESVFVHVQKYIGLDVDNQPMYSDVYQFAVDSVAGGSISTNGLRYVPSIADLQQLTVTNNEAVMVTGYLSAGDCPARLFVYNSTYAGAADSVTVISSVVPSQTGKFIWRVDKELDVRCAGVSTSHNNNSYLTYATNCAAYNGLRLYFPSGEYPVGSGELDINSTFFAAEDFKLTCAGGEYVVNLYQGNGTIISNTFAGQRVSLKIWKTQDVNSQDTWQDTYIPYSAWDQTGAYPLGFTDGNAAFRLDVTVEDSNVRTENSYKLTSIRSSVDYSIMVDVDLTIGKLEGTGKMINNTSTAPAIGEFATSQLGGSYKGYVMAKATGTVTVDSDVNLLGGLTYSATYIKTTGKMVLPAGALYITGSLVGKNILGNSGSVLCAAVMSTIDADWFESGNDLVGAYNVSTTVGSLDLKGKTASRVVLRDCQLRNGTIGGLSNTTSTLSEIFIDGDVLTNYISWTNVSVNTASNIDDFVWGVCRNVTFNNTSNSTSHIWSTAVTFYDCSFVGETFNIYTKGNTSMYNCVGHTGVVLLIPNSANELKNIYIQGGSFSSVIFDATLKTITTGEAVASNIYIHCNTSNLVVNDNSTMKFAVSGHSQIDIDCGAAGKTRGSSTEHFVSKISNQNSLITANNIFVLRNVDTPLSYVHVVRYSTSTRGGVWNDTVLKFSGVNKRLVIMLTGVLLIDETDVFQLHFDVYG